MLLMAKAFVLFIGGCEVAEYPFQFKPRKLGYSVYLLRRIFIDGKAKTAKAAVNLDMYGCCLSGSHCRPG